MSAHCDDCSPPPPDFMLVPPPPPPPPPPHLQELCHYQGDCSHHPVIDTLHTNSSIVHVISLVTVTTLTIVMVVVVSCFILLRYKFPVMYSVINQNVFAETTEENQ